MNRHHSALRAIVLLCAALPATFPLSAQAVRGRVLEGRTLQSTALARDWSYTVYLPPGYESEVRAYPVFYLLHGYGGEHTNWTRYGDAAMTADSLIAAYAIPPVILIMPDGKNSYWVDSDPRTGFGAVETALVRDLIPHVDGTYRTIPDRRARMIGGLSMGGYGAVHLAMKHPDLFGAAASMSGALYRAPPQLSHSLAPVFGDPIDTARWQAENPFNWIDRLKASELRLPMYITVGDDDAAPLLEGGVAFYAALRNTDLPAELRVTDGPHSWEVWDHALRETLIFFSDVFRARYR